jgi:hypothetical protein
MRKTKDFSLAKQHLDQTGEALQDKALFKPVQKIGVPQNTVVSFGVNATESRNYDFSKHYGQGFDAITSAVQQTIEVLLHQKTVQVSTISSYCRNGFLYFAEYLVIYQAVLAIELTIEDISIELIENYISHLKRHYPNDSTAKNFYNYIKSILLKMQQLGWLARFEFPRNPFPHSNRKVKGQQAFSKAERKRVAHALRIDVNEMLKIQTPLGSYELTIGLLAIALRSGMNTTPLLEMTTDSIKQHPLKENRKLLVLYKRRGNATQVQSLRHSVMVENAQTVLADVAIIVQHIIEQNQALRKRVNSDLVFCFVSTRANKGAIVSLSTVLLRVNIAKWVVKHGLTDDSGNSLVVNVSRFRKSFENRIWELSGGDPFVTAALSNHTVQVSHTHYLEAPKEAEKNFNLMGRVMTDERLGRVEVFDNTPVAKCSDKPRVNAKSGQPDYCTSFLNCVRCNNMVVTQEDLYRLFSFYWLIVYEREQIGAKKWKKYFAHIIRIVDQDIASKFDADYVANIRAEAESNPHSAWKHRHQLEEVL